LQKEATIPSSKNQKSEPTMKTVKTLLAATVLSAAPALAMAECSFGKMQQAQSCAPGTSWDGDKAACVADATS